MKYEKPLFVGKKTRTIFCWHGDSNDGAVPLPDHGRGEGDYIRKFLRNMRIPFTEEEISHIP